MPELRLDADGYLDLDEIDDGNELAAGDAERADAALKDAFDVDLAPGWHRAMPGWGAAVAEVSHVDRVDVVPFEPRSEPPRRRQFPGAVLAAAAVVALVIGAVGFGLGWFDGGSGPDTVFSQNPTPEPDPDPTAPAPDEPESPDDDGDTSVDASDPTPPPLTPDDPAIGRILVVGEGPRRPVAAGGALWIPNRVSGTITRVGQDGEQLERLDIEVGARPDAPLGTADAVWVPVRDDGLLVRIDLETLETSELTIGADPDTPVLAGGLLFVPLRGQNELAVVDPTTVEVVGRISLDGRPLTPVVVGDDLWFVTRDDNALHRLGVAAFEVGEDALETIEVGADPDRPLFAEGLLWVPARDAARIDVVDPEAATLLASIPVGSTPDTPVSAGGRIWVPNAGGGAVSVIDAQTFEVLGAVQVGSTPRTGDVDGTTVWIPVADRDAVVAIDAETLEVVQVIETGAAPDTPAVIGESLWVPNGEGTTVVEIRLG